MHADPYNYISIYAGADVGFSERGLNIAVEL